MHSPWTVFINLSVLSLFGAAAYVGQGQGSIYARHESARPVPANAPAEVPVIVAKNTTSGRYVPAVSAELPVVLASAVAFAEAAADEVSTRSLGSVSDPILPPDSALAVVTGEAVNLRLGPSTSFDRIGSVVNGDELVLTGVSDGSWVQVEHPVDGSPVWISEKFIR
jgi:hypothetical protein